MNDYLMRFILVVCVIADTWVLSTTKSDLAFLLCLVGLVLCALVLIVG